MSFRVRKPSSDWKDIHRTVCELCDSYETIQVQSSTILVNKNFGNVTLEVNKNAIQSGKDVSKNFFPFKLYRSSFLTGSDAWRTVIVRQGQVAGLEATNCDEAEDPWSSEIPDPGTNKIVVPASTSAYLIWLDCSVNSSDAVTASAATGGTTFPTPTAGHAYWLIGQCDTATDGADSIMDIYQLWHGHVQPAQVIHGCVSGVDMRMLVIGSPAF